MFFLDWNGIYHGNFMMTAFYLLVICSLIIVIASYLYPEQLKESAKILVWKNWREPLRGEAHGHVLGNYRILAALVLITFVFLYYVFR
jgi:cytochrome bd-type quinol oxidase subunit 2